MQNRKKNDAGDEEGAENEQMQRTRMVQSRMNLLRKSCKRKRRGSRRWKGRLRMTRLRTLFLPHFMTPAARRFWSLRELMARRDFSEIGKS